MQTATLPQSATATRQKKSERNLGVELFRVISMLMVVLLHILGNGGVLSAASREPLSASYKIAYLLQVITYCSVNCYALISGFANVKTEFKFRRFVYLWLETVFLITALNLVMHLGFSGEGFAVKREWWISGFFPLIKRELWYLCAYFFMYPLIPILNKGLLSLKKWQHIAVMIMLQAPAIFKLLNNGTDNYVLGGGYSAIWLICLYVIGAYFRIYGAPKWAKWFVTLPIFALATLVAWGAKIIPEVMVKNGTLDTSSAWYTSRTGLISYISPCMVVMSVALLVFFMQVPIRGKVSRRVIAELGRATWGVFVLHVSAAFWYYTPFWSKLRVLGGYSAGKMLFLTLMTAVGFYLAMSALSIARFYLFKLCRVQKGVDLLADLPSKWLEKGE